jgi:hypothetical protein
MVECGQPAPEALTTANLNEHTKKTGILSPVEVLWGASTVRAGNCNKEARGGPTRQRLVDDRCDSKNPSIYRIEFDGTERLQCSLFSKESTFKNESVPYNPTSFLARPESCASSQEPKILVDQFDFEASEVRLNPVEFIKKPNKSKKKPAIVKTTNDDPKFQFTTKQNSKYLKMAMAYEKGSPWKKLPLSLKAPSRLRKAAPISSELRQTGYPNVKKICNSFDSWDDDWNGSSVGEKEPENWFLQLDEVSTGRSSKDLSTRDTAGGIDNESRKSKQRVFQEKAETWNDENVESSGFNRPGDVNSMACDLFVAEMNDGMERFVRGASRQRRRASFARALQNLRTTLRWVSVVAVLALIGGGHNEMIPKYPQETIVIRMKRAYLPPPVRLMNTNPSSFRFETTTL